MTLLKVLPSTLRGEVRAPPSKGYTHRALAVSALTRGRVEVHEPLLSADTEATLGAIQAFGSRVERSSRAGVVSLTVEGDLQEPGSVVQAANSGTTLRFTAGLASLIDGLTVITGDASLRCRPMGPLLASLEELGARTMARTGGMPPVCIRGGVSGGRTSIPGGESSQYISALMLAGAGSVSGVEICITGGQVSTPYIDMTRRVLERFGVQVEVGPGRVMVTGGRGPHEGSYTVPGDYSSAAFILAAAAGQAETEVTVSNLQDRSQADAGILGLLKRYGSRVKVSGERVTVEGDEMRPLDMDLGGSPDLFPVLCILAARAEGRSVLSGAPHLRFKESDRIDAMHAMLNDLGVRSDVRSDGLVIHGSGRIPGGAVEHRGDHRIAMAGAVAGLLSETGVTLSDPEVCGVSYPGFFGDLGSLGARFEVKR